MAFHFYDLDVLTRDHMLRELARDRAEGRLEVPSRILVHRGEDYLNLLERMLTLGAPEPFAATLRAGGLCASHEVRRVRGEEKMVRVPKNAALLIAEGAFNHYYIRAVCQRALEHGISWVLVYRARPSTAPRASSQALEGMWVGAAAVHDDLLRGRPRLGVPGGPNSGISVRLPRVSLVAPGVPFTQVPAGMGMSALREDREVA